MKTIFFTTALGVLLLGLFNAQAYSPIKGIKHVVIIGIDGMSPDGIKKAATPVLDNLIENGAHTFSARAVLPTSSSTNWATMMMGAGPEQHGITSNGWKRNNFVLPPVVVTEEGYFPTIFTLFKDQKPEAIIGAVYDWGAFGRLFEKSDVDFDIDGNHEDGTTKDAIKILKEKKPSFTFIHLDHVDHAGHAKGHGTPAYYKSVEKADKLIGKIIQATKETGFFESTMFIICSDHGGYEKGHGGERLCEVEIPFIMYGAGIKKGYKIERAVFQYDNAATVAFAFGLETPEAWIGRPIKDAFIGFKTPTIQYKRNTYIKPLTMYPKSNGYMPSGAIFTDKSVFRVENPNELGDVYYTKDGTEPTFAKGMKYKKPVTISDNCVVKAGLFINGKQRGVTSVAYFRKQNLAKKQGLNYKLYYVKDMESLPNFEEHKVVKTGRVLEPSLAQIKKEKSEGIAILFEGYVQIDEAGDYRFYTNSDDGSKLFIDNKLVVDNDGNHGVREKSGKITLDAGLHPIKIAYYNGGGASHIDVKYEGETIPKQLLPVHKLYYSTN